ncbi:hypothetical protein ACRAWD_31085 [Caulobacter segnis]
MAVSQRHVVGCVLEEQASPITGSTRKQARLDEAARRLGPGRGDSLLPQRSDHAGLFERGLERT